MCLLLFCTFTKFCHYSLIPYTIINTSVEKSMCGRTACTLDKCSLQKATCRYSLAKGALPKWVDINKGQQYHPSYNVAPGHHTPVLVKETVTCTTKKETEDLVICPMRWGLVPSWHRGQLEDFSLKTTNCRLESIYEKPTYRGPLQAGRRCVILADGFFEWKSTGNGKKQPYFIYFPQEKSLDMSSRAWENDLDNLWTETDEWNGPRLLTMAGIFDVWKSPENGDLYSYSVITMDSSNAVSSIHSRMPAILDGDDHVKMWLDSGKILHKEALCNLECVQNLEFHAVSTEVNNSRNNTINCVLPLHISESPSKCLKRTGLTAWLLPQSHSKSPSPERKRMKSEISERQ